MQNKKLNNVEKWKISFKISFIFYLFMLILFFLLKIVGGSISEGYSAYFIVAFLPLTLFFLFSFIGLRLVFIKNNIYNKLIFLLIPLSFFILLIFYIRFNTIIENILPYDPYFPLALIFYNMISLIICFISYLIIFFYAKRKYLI